MASSTSLNVTDILAHPELWHWTICFLVRLLVVLRLSHAGTFLEFIDTSIVVLSGTISIANTAEFNGGTNRPCNLMGAQVCAVNHFGVGEGFWCASTNEFGLFACARL